MDSKRSWSSYRGLLLGVCTRISSHLRLPLSMVRVIFLVALALKFKVTLMVYLLLALLLRP